MKNLIIVAIAIISLSLTSCEDYITGEGMVVTETFDLNDFSNIETNASFDVVVSQGPDQKIEVEGQQNIIDRVQLNVSNGTLKMDLENGNYKNIELTVHITIPTLDRVVSSGSGDIEIKELEGDDLEIKTNGSGDVNATDKITLTNEMKIDNDGSGDIELDDLVADEVTALIQGSGKLEIKDGSTQDLTITLQGSGDIQLYNLQSEDVTVTSQGSGDIQVKSMNTLTVNLGGSGDVKYKGNPTITVTDTGSGDLIDAN